MQLLNNDQIRSELASLHGWVKKGNSITKKFFFRDFVDAFAFMCRVSIVAEALNHHPEWCNVYNKVEIKLSTHEAKGLTSKDFALAQQIESVL